MRRALGERLGKGAQVEGVAHLKRSLADTVLLCVVLTAQADGPAVGGLEALTAVGALPYVSALDGG